MQKISFSRWWSIGYLQPSAPQLYTKVVFTQQIKNRLRLKTFGFKSKSGHKRAFTWNLKDPVSLIYCVESTCKATSNFVACVPFLCWKVVWMCCGDGEDLLVLVGKWADPGGTAMPGQPVTRPEQAPEPHPLAKISLISKGAHGPRIRY